VVDHDEVLRRHGFHRLRVKAVVDETADARSFVLDVPPELRDAFRYQPGQFCSFRVHLGGADLVRCYSMSSAPETDADLTVTVKRVPGGAVSNWFNDEVAAGDELEVTAPAGAFVVRSHDRPVLAYCGGSGVTPVMAIAKSLLASTTRPVRMLYANRDRESVIFAAELAGLAAGHPDRFVVVRHHDADGGFLDADAVRAFVGDDVDADHYICGPPPFMDLVEGALLAVGVPGEDILIERFSVAPSTAADEALGEPSAAGEGDEGDGDAAVPETVVIVHERTRHVVAYHRGDTILETARRGNIAAPYSCESGTCATCMALVHEGSARMRTNQALEPDEVAEGWILTCQAVPISTTLVVEYEPM
jgi:3-ketosteroid 9alpha-monooxygenase subunit B